MSSAPNTKFSSDRSGLGLWEQMSHTSIVNPQQAAWMGGVFCYGGRVLPFTDQSRKFYFCGDFRLHSMTARQISKFNFFLFSWHVSETVKDTQEKSRQGDLCFDLTIVCAVQKPYFKSSFFHIYSRLLFSNC